MDLFGRASIHMELERTLMQLALIHNPYAKDTKRLHQLISSGMNSLKRGSRPERGVRIGDLARAFGGIKRKVVSREEWERIYGDRKHDSGQT